MPLPDVPMEMHRLWPFPWAAVVIPVGIAPADIDDFAHLARPGIDSPSTFCAALPPLNWLPSPVLMLNWTVRTTRI